MFHLPIKIAPQFRRITRATTVVQRKRHIKVELCVGLSGLRLFYIGNVVQNRRSALPLAWYEWFLCKGKEWKVYCCGLALSSEPQKWKFHVVIWQTTWKLHQKACRTSSTIIFPHSTNQIIYLWRRRCRCCRHFLNSLLMHWFTCVVLYFYYISRRWRVQRKRSVICVRLVTNSLLQAFRHWRVDQKATKYQKRRGKMWGSHHDFRPGDVHHPSACEWPWNN